MAHIDRDDLALIALGEHVDPDAARHLDDCDLCRDEMLALQTAAQAGRGSLHADRLEQPHPRVWEAIRAETGISSEAPEAPRPLSSARRRPRRRALVAVLAAAAAALVAVAGVGVWQALRPVEPRQLAAADLAAFPDWPEARGTAELEEQPDGTIALRVELDAPPVDDGFREVWLIDPASSSLISLGVLESGADTFVVPADIDPGAYSTVDISAEPADGDPEHSGDSIVRGALERGDDRSGS
jgi:hypothetical protein